MKKSYILLALVALFVLSGCDFMRKLAGRPTSEDIEIRRVEILRAEEAALQARLDSLKQVEQKMISDSLNALDSIRQLGGSILNPASLGGLFATKLESRYYIIIGSFRTRSNAEALFTLLNIQPPVKPVQEGHPKKTPIEKIIKETAVIQFQPLARNNSLILIKLFISTNVP